MVIVLIIVAAAAALALGLLTGPFLLVWVALGLSLVGVALVAVSLIRGRTRTAEHDADEPSDAAVDDEPEAAEPTADPVDADQEPGEQSAEAVEPAAAAAAEEAIEPAPALETVLVRAGRSRFHQEGCRVLEGAPAVERIHVDEAAAEGFTACSVCIPDRASLRVGG